MRSSFVAVFLCVLCIALPTIQGAITCTPALTGDTFRTDHGVTFSLDCTDPGTSDWFGWALSSTGIANVTLASGFQGFNKDFGNPTINSKLCLTQHEVVLGVKKPTTSTSTRDQVGFQDSSFGYYSFYSDYGTNSAYVTYGC
jgi:hypothetical protein